MLASCEHRRLKPDWAVIRQSGNIRVVEQSTSGAGAVEFSSSVPTLHLKHLDNQPPLKWARNGRCADGAIIAETGTGFCLHVVELKSRITRKEWVIVKQQLEGMIANAIAALGREPIKAHGHAWRLMRDRVGRYHRHHYE